MKRYLIAAFLLLAFAVPAWACTLTWTNALENGNWEAAGNWYEEVPCEPPHKPNTGDTVQFLNGNLALPSLGLPNAGEVFALVLDGASAGSAWDRGLIDFCGTGNWTYSSLQVGAAGRNGDNIYLNRDSGGAPNTITVYGYVNNDGVPTPIANATITVKPASRLECWTNNWAITQAITVEAGGTLLVSGVTLLANGGVNLAGTLNISAASSVLDVGTLPLTCTGDAVILWGGEGDILGGLNAGGFAVTHTGATSANSITCDVAGILDLGTTTANAIVVTTTAAVTIGNSFACGTLSTGANVAGASKTITVGAGGYTMTNGTLSGTLTVDLSAGAGAYTQTAGTIAADAVLNVTTGTGAVTFTALTKTGTGAITITINPGTPFNTNIGWASAIGSRIDKLTINTGKTATQTATINCTRLDGAGTLTAGEYQTLCFLGAAGDWSFTGTMTGTDLLIFRQTVASLSLTNPVNIGSRPFRVIDYATGADTLTLAGLTCGGLSVYSSTPTKMQTLIINGNSSGAALAVGSSTNLYGSVTFGAAGVHKWTSTIQRGGTGDANALNPQGRCIFTGTMTGTGIVVTPTSEGVIDCVGKGRVTAVVATGRRLVVRRAVGSAGAPVRSWNGDGCTNVMFKGRKVIGEPGVN